MEWQKPDEPTSCLRNDRGLPSLLQFTVWQRPTNNNKPTSFNEMTEACWASFPFTEWQKPYPVSGWGMTEVLFPIPLHRWQKSGHISVDSEPDLGYLTDFLNSRTTQTSPPPFLNHWTTHRIKLPDPSWQTRVNRINRLTLEEVIGSHFMSWRWLTDLIRMTRKLSHICLVNRTWEGGKDRRWTREGRDGKDPA